MLSPLRLAETTEKEDMSKYSYTTENFVELLDHLLWCTRKACLAYGITPGALFNSHKRKKPLPAARAAFTNLCRGTIIQRIVPSTQTMELALAPVDESQVKGVGWRSVALAVVGDLLGVHHAAVLNYYKVKDEAHVRNLEIWMKEFKRARSDKVVPYALGQSASDHDAGRTEGEGLPLNRYSRRHPPSEERNERAPVVKLLGSDNSLEDEGVPAPDQD